jgi:AcrR family transcriptional regulator
MYIVYTKSMGRPPRIDRRRILTTALAVADAEGLGALTMSALADRLEVTPMALYRHVRNKADVLNGVVELLLTEFPPPPADLPWPERLAALAGNIRSSARRHPSVFPLLLQRPATTAQARRTREAVYTALNEAGVAANRIAQVERLVSTAILGFAVSEAAGRFQRHSRRQLDADFQVLQGLLADFILAQTSKEVSAPPPAE